MLIEKNVTDKRKSWYICDRCGKRLTGLGNYRVYIQEPNMSIRQKKYDLCLPCYKLVNKYIERGIR